MLLRAVARQFLPRRLKPHRILRGPLAGKRIVTCWHDYPAAILGYAERALVEWLLENVRPGETWLDVGAHYGYTAIAMCERVGKHGRVFAFEPSLATAGCLERTRALNGYDQMTIVPFALTADRNLRIAYFPSIRGMIDSQLKPAEAKLSEQAICVSLDSIWATISANNHRINGIKIDVQGMEIETLLGMQHLLREQRPLLVIEVHPNVRRSQMLEILDGAGYDCPPNPIEKNPTDFFDASGNYSFLFTRSEMLMQTE